VGGVIMNVICYACIKDINTGELKQIERMEDMPEEELIRYKNELIISGASAAGYQLKK